MNTAVTLDSSVACLKGVGPQKQSRLSAIGIYTLRDLLYHFPRSYCDRSQITPLLSAPDTTATFLLTVFTKPTLARIAGGKTIVSFTAGDNSARVRVYFFHQPYLRTAFEVGATYRMSGKLSRKNGILSLANPQFDRKNNPTDDILPTYPLTEGISSHALSLWCREAFSLLPPDAFPESLSREMIERHHFLPLRDALYTLHFPTSGDNRDEALRRMRFETLFHFSKKLLSLRKKKGGAKKLPFQKIDLAPFLSSLPFSLTGAQSRAIEEICRDMYAAPHAMNRLLQGDVGSGKTVVAAAAVYHTVKNGYAAAMMAPTSLLATQHASTLDKLLSPHGIRVALLTGSTTKAQRRILEQKIQNNEVDLLIGTHALLEDWVQIPRLALVITDEQHRFGVNQRKTLALKAAEKNILVMSATPIPRTLAMFMYADLSISVLDELPPNRKPIQTFLVTESYRERIYKFIRGQIAEGHQVYIVCPFVENDDEDDEDRKAVENYFEVLKNEIFPDLSVGYLHGRQKPEIKEQTMAAFASGETALLLSTTVIEVGVDVPNATLMIIENAERFGLSQLHQLRGRVGRGDSTSYCVLFSSVHNQKTKERLSFFASTNNGFKIAEHDLLRRGPGDFFGSRQSGEWNLPLGDGFDLSLFTLAQEEARLALGIQ